jgi:DNA modification methylase
VIQGKSYTLHIGNNLDILPTLPDNSVDSIVTDPPYELGFMGKKWDSSGIAYSVELWTQCLRVLKPGGHLLSFGGTRTWHRVAVAIEDAGFEVRDSIAWMYGSGFPKSLDVSKAIDKRGGESIGWFGEWLRSWRKENNISQKEVAALFPSKSGNLTGCVANWELGLNLPTAEQFTTICRHFNLPFDSIAEAEREVIGKKDWSNSANHFVPGENHFERVNLDITAPSTPEAKQWEGWGTALKPAFEPIVVARKPLIGTVAENVLTHGTGGLNIDGSRIGTEERTDTVTENGFGSNFMDDNWEPSGKSYQKTVQGRWPSNVILDEYSAELLDEQSGVSVSKRADRGLGKKTNDIYGSYGDNLEPIRGHNDSGGASRFFYVAKASKRDRNEGLEGLDPQRHSDRENAEGVGGNNPRNRTNEAKQNFHPTVKPTDLMRYLIKLVTPPGGVVLDPFTGSGSTGKAAILEGFRFIGCELTEDYIPIIQGRLDYAEEQVRLAEEKKDEALF